MLDKNRHLYFYNTLTKKKDLFKPITDGFVGIYCCGPTVYSDPHVGHAKSAITYDILVRFLRYLGYNVRYVRNITDVGHLTDDSDDGEDKIIKKAKLEKLEPMEIVDNYLKGYLDAVDRLNILRPNISPRASAYIPEQIEAIKNLVEKGIAYEINGSVYFDISKFSKYGKLSGKKIYEQKIGARVAINEEKHHPADFSLWKKADLNHILKWNSPWGYGFPGWHIECSVMSMKFLGDTIDIHGGGIDLQFPHHECEIAQSEGITGKKFVNYWIHNNMVTIEGIKMSKSLGNFTTIKDLTDKYNPMSLRYFILNGHYRSILDFSEKAILASEVAYKKLSLYISQIKTTSQFTKNTTNNIPPEIKKCTDLLLKKTLDSLADDLNTPKVIAAVFSFINSHNDLTSNNNLYNKSTLGHIYSVLSDIIENLLGLKIDYQEKSISLKKSFLDELNEIRDNLRNEGHFKESDAIRKLMETSGIQLQDNKL